MSRTEIYQLPKQAILEHIPRNHHEQLNGVANYLDNCITYSQQTIILWIYS